MDVFRFLRALQARSIERIEQTRKDLKSGKLDGKNLSSEEAERIQKHDKIFARLMDGLDG